LKTQKIDECREARVRLAFCLQMKHGITLSDMSQLMGISEKNYRDRLKRLGFLEQMHNKPSATESALQRLQAELNKLIDGDELPDKSKAEALMALAKAVKTVGDLATETETTTVDNAGSVVSLHEVRQALIRIDRRIEDLAQRHAREIVERGLDAKSDNGSGSRMADQGA